MTIYRIELGRRYFCRQESSGGGHFGTFQIDADEISATFCSFDEPLPMVFSDPLQIRLENGRLVSLYKNVPVGGTTYQTTDGKTGPFTRRIISNITVIGPDAWHPDDPVRRAFFSIPGSDELLQHSAKFDQIGEAEFGDVDDPLLCEFAVAGIKVKIWYTASGVMAFRRVSTIDTRFGIEFDEPADLDSYLAAVQCIVRFASAALGWRLAPSDIHISRLSQPEFLQAVEDHSYPGDHQVRYIWPGGPPAELPWVGHAFAHVREKEELAAFVACLQAWIERDPEWLAATNLMMTSLSLEGTISGERLLIACKWLEEIPGAASALAVSETDIEMIASTAAAEADRLGHGGFKERIAGVIRGRLKTETNAGRFERLRQAVTARFGVNVLDAGATGHLLRAMQFRGRVAHGHFSPRDDSEYQAFVKATYAMEALCYLLTIKNLPMTEEGANRAIGRDIASNYRYCGY